MSRPRYTELNELGFDTRKIVAGIGTAPLPPVKKDATRAMGTTNDATIYHGRIMLTMKAPEIKDYLEKIPSNKSKGYGKPFYEIFKEAKFDFYKIDTSLFSPAEVVINELTDGIVYHVGAINPEVTLKSFGLSEITYTTFPFYSSPGIPTVVPDVAGKR